MLVKLIFKLNPYAKKLAALSMNSFAMVAKDLVIFLIVITYLLWAHTIDYNAKDY